MDIGRRSVWRNTCQEVQIALVIAERAELASKNASSEPLMYEDSLSKIEALSFPLSVECDIISDQLRDYAVVRFCTLFGPGERGSTVGTVQNHDAERIICELSADQATESEVKHLLIEAKNKRNNLIAHSSGKRIHYRNRCGAHSITPTPYDIDYQLLYKVTSSLLRKL